jgi:hypothetical protein
MGACPGNEESAGVNDSHRCPKVTAKCAASSQAANAAVKAKRTILHERVRYEERAHVDINLRRRDVRRRDDSTATTPARRSHAAVPDVWATTTGNLACKG